jgi:hypothetical protein
MGLDTENAERWGTRGFCGGSISTPADTEMDDPELTRGAQSQSAKSTAADRSVRPTSVALPTLRTERGRVGHPSFVWGFDFRLG